MTPPPDIRPSNPNPFLLGVDHLLRIRSDQLGFYEDLRRQHGDAVQARLGPYRLWYFFHPDLIEPVLTKQASSFIRFRKLMAVLRQWNGDSLLLAEGAHWRDRRRKVLPAFQSRRLPAYGDAIVDETSSFLTDLTASADTTGRLRFDADAAMARLTLNIAVRTMFGARPPGAGHHIESAVQTLSAVAFAESTSLRLPIWLPLPAARRKRDAMAVMQNFVGELVDEALAREDEDGAFLISSLVEHHERNAGAIRDDAMSLLIAGHETSGALLGWALAALAKHPEWLQRAVDEVDTTLAGRPPCMADLMQLPIVTAVINETLRLYPPAYTLFPREATSDLEISGQRIRRGDLVQVVPYLTQRDERFFDNAQTFNPDRFRAPATWPTYAYLPFGAGQRVCIGQSFGLMETALALARILQVMLPDPIADMPEAMARYSLRPRGGLELGWTLRS